ncbi:amidophosphoribosyltransferase [Megasphaera cerevisiae DSM 20462]|jgi:amidophosphoribosyltransferase|uniref:Amidophosphoribosyltransferase n=1 Tax=Megasphaera cerevisiae DSM 20462 TaxID=1122219 RepID=A0A0J6X003_9FIRM|nr:amidophosphoribosyltransferase [Megasphaera cerevisiae]KMO87472.1 amidophosphoribosyltransferase [Megasphaera cerevisiae DSM 20462]MCI1750824.1 amidophosphoribosyltransferase [Megasphaera cerevisiae]OKY53807.1 amidophosphoribosyltransferase [Megasphaera cerevisiae]SJZ37106.1 amidophosphoribosyltransferase [Megasphaera cerevisiae DSM 20462]
MFYDPIWDKQHEECGVLGIFDKNLDIPRYIYWGLFALQHRGQESGGMALTDGSDIHTFRGMGLISSVFSEGVPEEEGHIGIGHVRYSTTGSNNPRNIQPLAVYTPMGQLALAHNGNLTNTRILREELDKGGATFQTTMDSEIIVNLISRSQKETIEERIMESMNRIHGAFSLVLMTKDKLYGVRDPHGFRPLCIGRTENGGWVLSSETCGLDAIGATFVRDVKPGEFVEINEQGVKSTIFSVADRKQVCSFEYIYFARPDSIIDGQDVYQARLNMGREMWNETQYDADLVISVPDSGNTAAIGYSMASGIPFNHGLIKNRYMGRTFIKPNQKQRELAVRMKLNVVKSVVRGKRIIMVDDSIVRGTTSGIICKLLREAGAKEVYMCVSAPPIMYPCFYGIDTSVRKELIASTLSVEQIQKYIGVDKLHFISIDGLCRSISCIPREDLCLACFNNDYPTDIPLANEEGEKYALERNK